MLTPQENLVSGISRLNLADFVLPEMRETVDRLARGKWTPEANLAFKSLRRALQCLGITLTSLDPRLSQTVAVLDHQFTPIDLKLREEESPDPEKSRSHLRAIYLLLKILAPRARLQILADLGTPSLEFNSMPFETSLVRVPFEVLTQQALLEYLTDCFTQERAKQGRTRAKTFIRNLRLNEEATLEARWSSGKQFWLGPSVDQLDPIPFRCDYIRALNAKGYKLANPLEAAILYASHFKMHFQGSKSAQRDSIVYELVHKFGLLNSRGVLSVCPNKELPKTERYRSRRNWQNVPVLLTSNSATN
jgi:hypothetical protein